MFKERIALSLLLLFLSTDLFSSQNGFEVMSFRPATDSGRYLSISDSSALNEQEWFLGTTLDYGYRPLQITQNRERESGILDTVFEQHIYGSFDVIKNRLEVGFDIPVGWQLRYKNPRMADSVLETSKQSLGDIVLNAKINLLDMDKHGVGFSVLPFISFPTGDSTCFFGNGVVTAGGTVIVETNLVKKVFFTMNLGLLGKKSYIFRDIDDASKLTGGLGISVAAMQEMNFSTELLFKTRLSGVFRDRVETPVELLTGIKLAIPETGLIFSGAVGSGLVNGNGAPQYRILLGVGYKGTQENKK